MQKFPVKQGKYLDGPQGGSHILHQAIVSSGWDPTEMFLYKSLKNKFQTWQITESEGSSEHGP